MQAVFRFFVGCIFVISSSMLIAKTETPRINHLVSLEKKIDYSGWSAFASDVKNCTPKKYTLPNPIVPAILSLGVSTAKSQGRDIPELQYKQAIAMLNNANLRYQILGWQKNMCRINIASGHAHEGMIKCYLPKRGVAQLVQFAQDAVKDKITIAMSNPIKLYCKPAGD